MLWLIGIATCCALVATIWAWRVPFYQEPDELAHVDYIFALFDAGHPFQVVGRHPHGEVAPQTQYIAGKVGYRSMRYNPYARAPEGYGTLAFFQRLDSGAPAPLGKSPGVLAPVPYLMYTYPPLYYVAEAAILSVAYKVSGSLSDGFFAMRASNVLLLVGTLFFSYFSFRSYGASERLSLLAVLAIGAFPLVSRISGYVQPDNATTFLIAAIVYAVARRRRDSSCTSDGIAIVALALLFLVKPHYAFAAWLVTAPLLTFRNNGRNQHPALRAAIVALPIALFVISARYLNPVSGLESPIGWIMRTRTLVPRPTGSGFAFYRLTVDALGQCLNGSVFVDFWLAFGFRGGRIFADTAAGPIFKSVTLIGFAAFLFAERLLLRRIRVIFNVERRAAVKLLVGNHPLNLYLLTTATLVAAHVLSGGALELEGRYWCPMLLPLAIIALRTVPRPLRVKTRHNVALTLAAAMAAYSVAASVVAVRAMNDDFYGRRPALREAVADITEMRSDGGASGDAHLLDLNHPQSVHVAGYALDMLTGFAAKDIYLEVDRGPRRKVTSVALPYPRVAQMYNDDRITATGFKVDLPKGALRAGRHRLRFFVGDIARLDGIPFWADAWIVVASNGRPLKTSSGSPQLQFATFQRLRQRARTALAAQHRLIQMLRSKLVKPNSTSRQLPY